MTAEELTRAAPAPRPTLLQRIKAWHLARRRMRVIAAMRKLGIIQIIGTSNGHKMLIDGLRADLEAHGNGLVTNSQAIGTLATELRKLEAATGQHRHYSSATEYVLKPFPPKTRINRNRK